MSVVDDEFVDGWWTVQVLVHRGSDNVVPVFVIGNFGDDN